MPRFLQTVSVFSRCLRRLTRNFPKTPPEHYAGLLALLRIAVAVYSPMTTKTQELPLLFLGVAMVAALVWAACRPFNPLEIGLLDHWYTHYPAHFLTFAALAIVWTLALHRTPPIAVALAIVAFSFMHEGLEIIGHAHRFELHDALVNALGTLVGVGCGRAALTLRA